MEPLAVLCGQTCQSAHFEWLSFENEADLLGSLRAVALVLGSPEKQWSANRYPATIVDHVLTETLYSYRYPLHPCLFVKSVGRVVNLSLIYANFILVAKSHVDPCPFYII